VLDSRIADQVSVIHSYVREATLEAGVTVGPFAYLRPGAVLRPGAKAGTFVEIKNSEIGRGAKVPHLSYIGDAEIGEGTNIGAATVTANYDGSHKHRTEIGAHAFVGVDTMLVAPVKVGDRAYTGAGSVITGDVPPDALGVARARQRNIEGYVERRKQREEHAEKHHPGH
jgi:bifunctional UDP-N-acetylglucosamine pyrophosphorylase/glucosamine-1-phosphate N-acetyltransferase